MHLKRIHLLGFKSFADRTDIDLAARLTGLVGPNGCGKSNVVDAVRWALGEQSARQLRGTEMADVIFSGNAARKPTGFAECSLTISNEDRRLPLEYDEVVITRRLYRSGESEYLLNKEPVRLRDLRRLLRGTGLGMNAYSIIEQGKVDMLLSASAKERRVVIEEAAGISQFKAQRRECELKLERTEQNLLRVGDIIEEVEKRLRSVKYQAAKARRYQEYAAQLKALRAQLSLGDYGRLMAASAALDREVADLTAAGEGLHQRRRQLADAVARHEQALTAVDDQLHAAERAEVEHDGRARQVQAAADHHDESAARLAREADQHDQHTAEAADHLAAAHARQRDLDAILSDLGPRIAAQEKAIAAAEADLRLLTETLEQAAREIDEAKSQALEVLRRASRVQNEIGSVAGLARTLGAQRDRQAARRGQLTDRLQQHGHHLERLEAARGDLEVRLAAADARLAEVHRQEQCLRTTRSNSEAHLAAARQRRSALAARHAVLADLEARLAGVADAVKAVLQRAAGRPGVHGLVADLIRVPHEYVAALEAALGEVADYLVVDSRRLALDLAAELADAGSPPGQAPRLGFLCRDRVRPVVTDEATMGATGGLQPVSPVAGVPGPAHSLSYPVGLPVGDPGMQGKDEGVLGQALDLIQADAPARAALATLLAGTVVVRDRETALAVTSNGLAGRCVVTLTGDAFSPDGRVLLKGDRRPAAIDPGTPADSARTDSAGPSEAGGRIWRRAEIEHLARQIADLDGEIARREAALAGVREELTALEAATTQAAAEANDARAALARTAAERDRVQHEVTGITEEATLLDREIRAADEDLAEAEQRLQALAAEQARLESEHQVLRQHIAEREALAETSRRDAAQRREALTGLKVAAAEARTRFNEAEANRAAALEEVAAWQRSRDQAAQSAAARRAEAAAARHAADQARQTIESLRARRQTLAQERADLAARRQAVLAEYTEAKTLCDRAAAEADQLNQRRQALLVTAGELRVKREDLVQRTREELGLDLAALHAQAQAQTPVAGDAPNAPPRGAPPAPDQPAADAPTMEPDQTDPEALRTRIADLREKIERLGGVNLEAIDELDELEIRATFLNRQRDDLTAAKADLERVIRKINKQCREMFTATFEQVRTHFQDLFRKLFGGGRADMFLEDGPEADVLESGIEIIARPPGKEPRALSLLSGGEKVMTAVAILLAVFRSNPSPFCILDEVDAALDESAIDRFVAVLQEFVQRSQFIIVTHNKRTMASTEVLYGVTMPEPGASRVITVRLEEVEHRLQTSRVA